ncbi:MAG: hypothetical protein D3903_07295 [Candidatus Electrothrix sp. GM3_4]|nr:hypothetical protein [Candidatus Electrothrix sp. GM3_4]
MGVVEFIAAVVGLFCIEQIYVKIVGLDLKRLNSWSKEIWQWLCTSRNIFGCIVVPPASVFICWRFFEQKDTALIVASGILQLAGMLQAMISLLQVWKYFQKDSEGTLWQIIIMKLWELVRKFPKWKGTSVNMKGCSPGLCGGVNIVPSEPEWKEDNLNESSDKRINAVVQNQKKIFPILKKHEDSIACMKSSIPTLQRENDFNISELKENLALELENLHLGDFIPTFVGLIWISLGIIMATLGSLF